MKSISINGWNDLEQLGINALTGEACAYMMRLLCDVNEDGRAAMLEYLGLPGDTDLAAPANSQVNGKPSVGSLMLHRDGLSEIGEFMLRRAGARALLHLQSRGLVGLFSEELVIEYERLIENWPASTHGWRLCRISPIAGPHVGSRNIHVMSGTTL